MIEDVKEKLKIYLFLQRTDSFVMLANFELKFVTHDFDFLKLFINIHI